MEIVCLGEALIDFKGTGPLAFQGFVGGSPLNVAVAAARLGASTALATQRSNDMFGESIAAHLRSNGVDETFVLRDDAPTTLAFVSERAGEAHFSFHANGTADALYDPRPRPSFPKSVRFVQFGSISLLQEPAAAAISETVAAHRQRCTIVFDPNVRPALIADRQRYLASLGEWLALAHLVKLSAQDLAWLHPGVPAAAVAEEWLERGPHAVIVTRGSAGLGLYRPGHAVLNLAPPVVKVVDTVGAGDALTGALMVAAKERLGDRDLAELSDAEWSDLLLFAAAGASLNCTREGAEPPRRAELEAFLGRQGGSPPEESGEREREDRWGSK